MGKNDLERKEMEKKKILGHVNKYLMNEQNIVVTNNKFIDLSWTFP